jgi:hypothetical protein
MNAPAPDPKLSSDTAKIIAHVTETTGKRPSFLPGEKVEVKGVTFRVHCEAGKRLYLDRVEGEV